MRTIFTALLFVAASPASAQTFQVDKLTGNTVFMAVQCDIGRFAKPAKKEGVDPAMKAHVSYSWAVEKNTNVSGSVSVSLGAIFAWLVAGPKVEAAAKFTKTDDKSMEGDFNINDGNMEACQEGNRPRVPVGLYSCLLENTRPLKAKRIVKCDSTRIAYGKVSAGGKITWLILTAEADAGYDIKVTYTIKISAPAKEEKKETS